MLLHSHCYDFLQEDGTPEPSVAYKQISLMEADGNRTRENEDIYVTRCLRFMQVWLFEFFYISQLIV